RLRLVPSRVDDRQIWNRTRCLVEAERAGNALHALILFLRKRAPRGQDLLDEVERLASSITVGGKHRRKCRERSFRVEQQDEELLAHERLERRERHVTVGAANAAQRFKAALVGRTPC